MRRLFLTLAAGLLTLSFQTVAVAQNSVFDIPEDQQKTFADLGIDAVYRETYVGSDKNELKVLPFIYAEYKGRYFINPALGAGAYAIKNETFRLGGSVHYNLGRKTKDTPLDGDAFDVDGGFAGLISSRLYTPVAAIDVIANIPLTGDLDGYRIDTLMTTELRPTERLRINPGIRATYHSGEFLDSLYGINDDQLAVTRLSTGSELTALSFGSEISTLGAHVAAFLELGNKFELVGVVNYSRLIGDVEGSTLAPRKDGFTSAVAIARKF
jgi:outer membrane scaffolding protein for murein synthesis (MipA/OmpV family)